MYEITLVAIVASRDFRQVKFDFITGGSDSTTVVKFCLSKLYYIIWEMMHIKKTTCDTQVDCYSHKL